MSRADLFMPTLTLALVIAVAAVRIADAIEGLAVTQCPVATPATHSQWP